jgi:hypothetical protein
VCMFCAAVPAAAAVGANLNAKQNAARLIAEEQGLDLKAKKPIARVTMAVIAILAVGSVVYHTLVAPIWKVWL